MHTAQCELICVSHDWSFSQECSAEQRSLEILQKICSNQRDSYWPSVKTSLCLVSTYVKPLTTEQTRYLRFDPTLLFSESVAKETHSFALRTHTVLTSSLSSLLATRGTHSEDAFLADASSNLSSLSTRNGQNGPNYKTRLSPPRKHLLGDHRLHSWGSWWSPWASLATRCQREPWVAWTEGHSKRSESWASFKFPIKDQGLLDTFMEPPVEACFWDVLAISSAATLSLSLSLCKTGGKPLCYKLHLCP